MSLVTRGLGGNTLITRGLGGWFAQVSRLLMRNVSAAYQRARTSIVEGREVP